MHAPRRAAGGAAAVAAATTKARRAFSAAASGAAEAEEMEFDVVVVGAGPAGLAAALRIRQARLGRFRLRAESAPRACLPSARLLAPVAQRLARALTYPCLAPAVGGVPRRRERVRARKGRRSGSARTVWQRLRAASAGRAHPRLAVRARCPRRSGGAPLSAANAQSARRAGDAACDIRLLCAAYLGARRRAAAHAAAAAQPRQLRHQPVAAHAVRSRLRLLASWRFSCVILLSSKHAAAGWRRRRRKLARWCSPASRPRRCSTPTAA